MQRRHRFTVLCLSLFLGTAGAFAQVAPAQGSAPDGQVRRAELRTALQVKPAPAASSATAQESPVRQLTPIERAEMRQQLREQQAQVKQQRP